MAKREVRLEGAEFLRLRKIKDQCCLAIDYLRDAERVLRKDDAFASHVYTAIGSIATALDSVQAVLARSRAAQR